MSEILLGQRHPTCDTVCGICCRKAIPVGIVPQTPGMDPLWICRFCKPNNALKVDRMTQEKLLPIEDKCIGKAIEASAQATLSPIFQAIWELGIRDVADMTPEQYAQISERVVSSPEYREAVRQMFFAYGNFVRVSITKE